MHSFKNQNGQEFEIRIEDADVPAEADFFGFIFVVKVFGEKEKHLAKTYKAIVKKELCGSEEKARYWVKTTALDFLLSVLETYRDGSTTLLIPNSQQWLVL